MKRKWSIPRFPWGLLAGFLPCHRLTPGESPSINIKANGGVSRGPVKNFIYIYIYIYVQSKVLTNRDIVDV
jgi:hypothetical protein